MKSWIIFSLSAMVPAHKDLPGIADTNIDAFLSKLEAEAPSIFYLGLRVAAIIFVISPILTTGIPLPAQWLSASKLNKHAEKIAESSIGPIRQMMMVQKMLAGLCWGENDQVRAYYGMEPYPENPGTWRQTETETGTSTDPENRSAS